MPNVLIIGATRGLGNELAKRYQARGDTVVGTARSESPKDATVGIKWVSNIDLSQESAGANLVQGLPRQDIDLVIFTAGYFATESFDNPDFDKEVLMYKTSAIGPIFVIHRLIIIVSSESGSIALRHESEGGGNFGHHGSKAASNMVGKLLSLDLKEKGITVLNVHPGFMRTEMTKSVGFDRFWDDGGGTLFSSGIFFVDTVDISKTGEYWAPRGPGDIGTAEHVLGPKHQLSTPLQLPW
ncbi:hypothetical protein BDV97DRAFT_375955 [Delphinella strobiligena]|nr:hypothetical protein BDV97DRAFT_375955 [Delphinella strobiligena]